MCNQTATFCFCLHGSQTYQSVSALLSPTLNLPTGIGDPHKPCTALLSCRLTAYGVKEVIDNMLQFAEP